MMERQSAILQRVRVRVRVREVKGRVRVNHHDGEAVYNPAKRLGLGL